MRGHAAPIAHRRNDISFFLPGLVLTLFKNSHHGYCTQSLLLVPKEEGRSRKEAKGIGGRLAFTLLFHQSKQLIFAWPQLIWAPATLALPREKGITRLSPLSSTSSLPLPSPQLCSPWLTGGGGCGLNYSLRSISSKFAFIFSALSLLFCCVCLLSGSRSESVSACCVISYQLWHWPAIVVMQKETGFYWCWSRFAEANSQRLPAGSVLNMVCVYVCVCGNMCKSHFPQVSLTFL